MKNLHYRLPVILLILLAFSCEKKEPDEPTSPELEEFNLLMGNPSQATKEAVNANNYLITLPQYALSYNRSRGMPNWVSWYLNSTWLGDVSQAGRLQAVPRFAGRLVSGLDIRLRRFWF
jgi:endonuclease G